MEKEKGNAEIGSIPYTVALESQRGETDKWIDSEIDREHTKTRTEMRK